LALDVNSETMTGFFIVCTSKNPNILIALIATKKEI